MPQFNAPGGSHPDPGLLSLMNQIQTDRLMAHVRTRCKTWARAMSTAHSPTPIMGWSSSELHHGRTGKNTPMNPTAICTSSRMSSQSRGQGSDSVQRNIAAIISGTDVGAGTLIIGAHV
ncbi:MAG UNVERIFIED_CONTAM: hypothetical protein LVT10_19230 [Anaerolineae bacterium]